MPAENEHGKGIDILETEAAWTTPSENHNVYTVRSINPTIGGHS